MTPSLPKMSKHMHLPISSQSSQTTKRLLLAFDKTYCLISEMLFPQMSTMRTSISSGKLRLQNGCMSMHILIPRRLSSRGSSKYMRLTPAHPSKRKPEITAYTSMIRSCKRQINSIKGSKKFPQSQDVLVHEQHVAM